MRTFKIANQYVLVDPGWSISDTINSRSTFSCTVVDLRNLSVINEGDSVEVMQDAEIIFSGSVDTIDDEEDLPGYLFYHLQCVDNNALADKRIIADSFVDTLAGDIVKSFITNTLKEEGVWGNTKALSFDGVNDSVAINRTFSVVAPYTITLWAKPNANLATTPSGGSLRKTLIVGPGPVWNPGIWVGSNMIRVHCVTEYRDFPINWTGQDWHMLGMVFDGVNCDVIWDGVLIARVNTTRTAYATPTPAQLLFGAELVSGTPQNWNGLIDDVRIWNVSRTQSEIQADMNRELIGNEPGLVGYWKFNEGSGTIAIDSTANANNGAVSGATYTTGFVVDSIADGPSITKAVFNYDAATTSLDYLKDVSGLNWNVDINKRMNFFDRSTNAAPLILNDTVQHSGFKRNRTRQQYRNRQYIRAGKGETGNQTLEKPAPKPDGVSRTFVLRFPLAKKPRIFINTVEVSSIDIGVNGLDTGKKYYFSYDSNVITQDTSQPVLSVTDVVEITYTGLFPILTLADNTIEITDRKARESGTSGVYEQLTKEASINSSASAIQYAQGLLEKYGTIPSTVSFSTEIHGLRAGQLLQINKPLYSISDKFLIESVQLSGNQQGLKYDVKCLDGSSFGGWEQFFKDLVKGNREFIIQENEVLILLNLQSERMGLDSSVKVEAFTSLFPSDTLFPSNTLFPGTKIDEVTIND